MPFLLVELMQLVRHGRQHLLAHPSLFNHLLATLTGMVASRCTYLIWLEWFTIVVCLSLIWCLSSIVLLGDLGHLCYCLNDYTYSTAKFYLFNFNQICLGYILYVCWPSALKFLIYRVHATLDPSPSTWHAKFYWIIFSMDTAIDTKYREVVSSWTLITLFLV